MEQMAVTMKMSYIKEWVIVDGNYGRYYSIHINAYDTNGLNNKPVRYFFQEYGQPFDTTQTEPLPLRKANTDTVMWYFSVTGTPNQTKQFWIAAIDDDKLLRGKISGTPWIVFADSAPPKPGMVSPQTPDSVLIRWNNYDAKDGPDSTIFEVLIGPLNGTPTTRKIIQAGALFTKVNGYYTYKIEQATASFSYRVIAQDKRGTRSLGDPQNYVP
jgi:hypothetical protein